MANKWRAIVEKVEEAWHDIMTSEAKQAEVPRDPQTVIMPCSLALDVLCSMHIKMPILT
jgi:hypothetical protein